MSSLREKIDVKESKTKKWRKNQLTRWIRRTSKILREDTPTKHLTKGWMT